MRCYTLATHLLKSNHERGLQPHSQGDLSGRHVMLRNITASLPLAWAGSDHDMHLGSAVKGLHGKVTRAANAHKAVVDEVA